MIPWWMFLTRWHEVMPLTYSILLNLMSDRAIGQALYWNMHVQTHDWSLCVSVRWSLLVCQFLARISCNVELILCVWLCEISAIMQKELCTILALNVKAIIWLQNRWIVRHMHMLFIRFFRPDSTIIESHMKCILYRWETGGRQRSVSVSEQ